MSLENVLESLPEHRREAVREWLKTSIGGCTVCGQAVLITHPHAVAESGFRHLDCEAAAQASVEVEPVSKNVDANARRADWG